ncbi:hypothetical protein GGI21_000395 [Coemansia aciculifera]|nr:hypothetical protein GGI21_000395 [Coemansia aciculifera]
MDETDAPPTSSITPPLLDASEEEHVANPVVAVVPAAADSDNQAIVPNATTTTTTTLEAIATVANEDAPSHSPEFRMDEDISGEYSTTSSLYGGSVSLIGTVGGGGGEIREAEGPATSIVGLAPTLGGGTLSPPHTLVNSDGASMRVHTGSIRERNFNRRISAIHEDDSDVYSESRRSDSLIFGQQQSSVSPSRRHRHHHYQNNNNVVISSNNSTSNSHHRLQQGHQRQRRLSEDGGGAGRVLSESDCLSFVSGISEGGASTTRVRLATDRAYDALRMGAPPAAHLGMGYLQYGGGGGGGGGSSSQYQHRAMSFATSSDPGLPSTGSFYDYYLDPNDYVPHSGSTRDDDDDDDDIGRHSDDSSSACGHQNHHHHHHHHHGRRRRRDEDIVSLIRSDIAVYGSAIDDVKFPFLPDNFSEFSGSVVYSPTDGNGRRSRDHSEAYYAPYQQPLPTPPPPQQQQQAPLQSSLDQNGSRASSNKKSRRGKDRLIIRNGKMRDVPNKKAADSSIPLANGAAATATGGSSQIRGGCAPPQPPRRGLRAIASPGPANNRPRSHYRRQSASEAYPSATAVTVVAVANASSTTGIRQTNNGNNGNGNSPAAIRPNALMRFFKRITPKT